MGTRLIKDSIRTSKSVAQMTDFEFRLWVYLITYVDDYGRGPADVDLIKAFCFPRKSSVTNKSIDAALSHLELIGSLTRYTVSGDAYLCFPEWAKYQNIRTKVSKWPGPEEADETPPADTCIQMNTDVYRCIQMNTDVSVIQSNPIQSNPNPESNPVGGTRAQRFVPPTADDVRAYCAEKGISIDADYFVSFYESKNWYVGKNKMVNWRAAVSGWYSREQKRNGPTYTDYGGDPF